MSEVNIGCNFCFHNAAQIQQLNHENSCARFVFNYALYTHDQSKCLHFGIVRIKVLLMKKINLISKEKMAVELRHKKCRDVKELDQIKAILLRSEDWTIPR
jgi:hypothetical protein